MMSSYEQNSFQKYPQINTKREILSKEIKVRDHKNIISWCSTSKRWCIIFRGT